MLLSVICESLMMTLTVLSNVLASSIDLSRLLSRQRQYVFGMAFSNIFMFLCFEPSRQHFFSSPVSHCFIQCSAIRGVVAKQGCFICLSDLSALTWLRQINQITFYSFSWRKLQNEMSGDWKSPHFCWSHFSLLPEVTEHHVDIFNTFWEFWGCEENGIWLLVYFCVQSY